MTSIEDYLADRGDHLRKVAFLLTGDRHAADDLVQSALVKVLPRWDTIVGRGTPDAYIRRTLLTTYLSWRRRPGFFDRPYSDPPARAAPAVDHDLRLLLLDALARLPRRQRATIVLRYFIDLSETQTAAALGCRVGTVKSQTAKAIQTLRATLGELALEERS